MRTSSPHPRPVRRPAPRRRALTLLHRCKPAILTASCAVLLARFIPAADLFTWDGGGANGNWSTAANWVGDAIPDGNDVLVFAGTLNPLTSNDLAGYNGHQFVFNPGAGPFTLTGNPVTLYDFSGQAPRVANLSTTDQTIALAVTFDSDAASGGLAEIAPLAGNFFFDSTVAMNEVTALRLTGDNSENARTVTFNGVVSGTGKIVVRNNATAVFSAANTFSGNLEIDRGTVRISTGGSLAAGTSVFVGSGIATGDAAALLLSGSGVTFGNTVSINPGNGSNRLIGGSNTNGVNTFTGPIQLDGLAGENRSVQLTAEAGGTVVFSGPITGAGQTVTKVGAGTVVLSGANTFGGAGAGLSINEGRLGVASDAPLGAGFVRLNGGSLQASGTFTLGAARPLTTEADTGGIDVTDANVFTVASAITGEGSLTKIGAGTLTLGGGAADTGANAYLGTTTVSDGTLALNKAAGVNAVPGPLLIPGGAVQWAASEQLGNGETVTVSGGSLTFHSGGAKAFSETVGNLSISAGAIGTATALGSSIADLNTITVTNNFTVTGGAPTVNSGTIFNVGTLTISGGTLLIGGNSALRNTRFSPGVANFNGGTITINYGTVTSALRGEFILNGNPVVGGSAATSITRGGTGTAVNEPVVVLGATRTFNVSNVTSSTAADLTIGVRIDNNAQGTAPVNAGLIKTGAGTLTLTGTGSTFTGNVEIQAGTLQINGSGTADPTALGAGAKTVTLTNNAALGVITTDVNPSAGSKIFVIGAGGGTLDVASGRTLTLDDGTTALLAGEAITTATAQLQGAGTLTKTGAGILTLGGGGNFATSFTGNTNHLLGLLNVTNAAGLGTTGGVLVDGTAGATRLNFSSSTPFTVPTDLTLQSGAVLSFAGANHMLSPARTMTIGAATARLRVDDGASATASGTARSIAANSALTGSGTLEVVGPTTAGSRGLLSLANAAGNFSGTLVIDRNVAVENNPRFHGTIPVSTGRTIGSATVRFSPAITGSGATDGLLDLRDNGTAHGETFAYGNAIDMSAIGGVIAVGAAPAGVAVPFTGHRFVLGTLSLGGGQTLTANGLNAATLEFSGATTLAGDATFTNTADVSLSGGIAGGASLVKNGVGRLTLGAPAGATYGGTTTINGGTLLFNSAAAIGGSGASVTVNAGGAAGVGFAIDQATLGRFAASSGGVVALGADSAGNLDLAGYTSLRIGGVGTASYTGTLAPATPGVHRLGGGGGTLIFPTANYFTGNVNLDLGTNGGVPGVIALAANDFTGAISLKQGQLLRTDAGNASLGSAANSVTFDGGGIQLAAGAPFDFFAVRPYTITANGAILDTNGNDFTSSVAIGNGNAGGFTKAGAGTLSLTQNVTYTGPTGVSGGRIAFDDVSRFGSSASLALTGGFFRYTGAGGILGKPVTAGTGTAATGFEVANAAARLSLGGVVSGGVAGGTALAIRGPGTVLLTASNSFAGDVVVTAGGVLEITGGSADAQLGNANGTTGKLVSLDAGTLRIVGGSYDPGVNTKKVVVTAGGGTLEIGSGFTLTLNDGSGDINSAAGAAQIQGAGTLTKSGLGTLTLGGSATADFSNFSGAIVVAGGLLVAGGQATSDRFTLGSNLAGTTVNTGATLELRGISTEPMTLAGGALLNISGAAGDSRGAVTLAADSVVGGPATLTFNGVISGGFALTKTQAGTTTLRAAGAWTGGTRITGGTLVLAGLDGTIAASAGITLDTAAGTRLLLNNDAGTNVTTGNNGNRVADAAPIALNAAGAKIELFGMNSASGVSSEALGAVTVQNAYVELKAGSSIGAGVTTALTLASLTRVGSSVVGVQSTAAGTLGGADRIVIASGAPAPMNGMLDPHFVDATSHFFASYGPNGFATAVATGSNIATSAAAQIVDDIDGGALTAPATAHALRLGAVALSGSTTTVASGGLILNGSATHTTSFIFRDGAQDVEGVIYVAPGTATLTAPITAAAVTKAGLGTLAYGAGNVSFNSLATAPLNVLGGTLSLPAAGNVANIYAFGPTHIAAGAVLSQPGAADASSLVLGGLSGAGTLMAGTNGIGVSSVTINQTADGIFSGTIGNNSRLSVVKRGAGDLAFTNTINVSDALRADFGELILAGNATNVSPNANRKLAVIGQGGALTFDNTGTNSLDRILLTAGSDASGGSAFTLNGGTFNFLGSGAMASSEVMMTHTNANGTPVFGAGSDVVNIQAGAAQSAAVTFSIPFTRNAGASVLVRGTNLGGARGAVDTASFVLGGTTPLVGGGGPVGSPLRGIYKGVFVDSISGGMDIFGIATYDAGVDAIAGNADDLGVRRLGAAEQATTFASGSTALENVRLTMALASIDTATTINSLQLDGGASVTGSGTLTLNAQTILSTGTGVPGASSIGVATLAFGTGEATIFAASDLTISSALTGTGGLTKGGPGTLTLSGGNASLSGGQGITVNGGLLSVAADSHLGTAGNFIRLNNGGGLRATAGFTTARSVVLGAAGGRLDVTAGNTITMTGGLSGGLGVIAAGISGTTGTRATETTVLTKTGAGTALLAAVSSFTGRVEVDGGTLLIGNSGGTGSLPAEAHVSVDAGGTLGGSGMIGGSVTVQGGGTLAPESSPGRLGTGSLALASGSMFSLEFHGITPALAYDQVNVTGAVSLAGGDLGISLGSFDPTDGVDVFYIILNDGADAVSGAFAGLGEGATFTQAGQEFRLTYQANWTGTQAGSTFGGGNDVALAAIPEPASGATLLASAALLLGLRRRRLSA